MNRKRSSVEPGLLSDIYTISFYFDRTLNRLVKTLNKLLRDKNIDLQMSQFLILRYLFFNDGLSQAEISNGLDKDPAAISRTVDYLVQKGYVTRKALNGKTMEIYLTPKAMDLKPQMDEVVQEMNRICLKGISETRQKAAIKFLKDIFNNATL